MRFVLSPDLNTGTTLANLRHEGNMPDKKLALHCKHKIGDITTAEIFTNLVSIPSDPKLLFGLSCLIKFKISVGAVKHKYIKQCGEFFKYLP